MPLQTQYRPTSFKEVYGNKAVVEAVRSSLKREDHNHCFLFTGPSGTGKTTLAYLVAQELDVYDPNSLSNPNFREINASSYKGIDMFRAVELESSKSPLMGSTRVFFLDEAHKLTPDAQEGFLKLLESASKTCNYYLFATTEDQKLKETFKRRCSEYRLSPLHKKELEDLLFNIIEEEEKDVPDEVLDQIILDSIGSPGIALGILDSIIALPKSEMLEAAKRTALISNSVIELCRALINKSTWSAIKGILSGIQKEDSEKIRYAVLAYCTSVILSNKTKPAIEARAYLAIDSFSLPTYSTGFSGIVKAAYEALHN